MEHVTICISMLQNSHRQYAHNATYTLHYAQHQYAKELTILKEEKQEPEFVKIYRNSVPELRWLMTNHKFASALLFFILEHMDKQNVLACSYSVFESYFDKHRSNVYRALKILKDHGFIHIYKMGGSNVYTVNNSIVFPEEGHFAKYLGNILISKHENKDVIAQEILKANRTQGHQKQLELNQGAEAIKPDLLEDPFYQKLLKRQEESHEE